MESTFTQIILFFIGGVIASYVCNILLLNFSQSLGIRNKNDVTIRWSNQSKPSLGGISFFVVFIFFAFAHSIIFKEDNIFLNTQYVGLLSAGTLAFIMGLADDAYNTKPYLKLFIQIACGGILVYSGTIIHLTNNSILNSAITVFWVVLLMNSLNMLDNMDGIAGTICLFIVATCLLSNWLLNKQETNVWFLLNSAMIGGIIAFLYFNIHPSKLFMGDAGSQFISLFVAYISIDSLWTVNTSVESTGSWVGILVVFVAFTVPFADTLTVVINRLRKRQSPMVGGRDHTTHHLVYAGFTDKQVWLTLSIIAFIASCLTLTMIYLLKSQGASLLPFFILYPIIVFYYLYRNTINYPQKQ